jgi:uncharacterized protein (TIGR03000 family)
VPEIKPSEQSGQAHPASAMVKITLPANATLFFNGVPMKQTGAERSFVTPPLARGDGYGYHLRAEVLVDDRLEVEERQIRVVAGAEVTESFPKLLALARQHSDRVTAK